jgi:hypothetical protein
VRNSSILRLARRHPQPPSDYRVEPSEQAWSGVSEVAEPSPRQRVEIGDDPLQAIARPRLVFSLTLSLKARRLLSRTNRRPASNR